MRFKEEVKSGDLLYNLIQIFRWGKIDLINCLFLSIFLLFNHNISEISSCRQKDSK
ncbi:hypothetical protein HMPREF1984_00753 [Leptotrichia sp. oral taxon 215 str. W9775]|nr:hypothetical protein HMPREF1984_00753 [Leptotrichia sp. oral taxon 215 str. W9775]